jgi:hypothetical protein
MSIAYQNEANGLRIYETEDGQSIEEVRAERMAVQLPLPWAELPDKVNSMIVDAARTYLFHQISAAGGEGFGDVEVIAPGPQGTTDTHVEKYIEVRSAYWPRPNFAELIAASGWVAPVVALGPVTLERAGFGGASAYETIAAEIGESLHAKHLAEAEHAHNSRESRDNCLVGLCDPATIVNDEEQPSYTPPRMTRLDMEGGATGPRTPAKRIVRDEPQA